MLSLSLTGKVRKDEPFCLIAPELMLWANNLHPSIRSFLSAANLSYRIRKREEQKEDEERRIRLRSVYFLLCSIYSKAIHSMNTL